MLCVTGKKGRVQDARMWLLRSYLPFPFDILSISEKKKFNPNKYDLVYYSQYALVSYVPSRSKKICSITSHKCLGELSKTLKLLKQFSGVSVNNTFLLKKLGKRVRNIHYAPNGVETNVFKFENKRRSKKLRLGWVGNSDRRVKNYKEILKPLMKIKGVEFDCVVTSKKDDVSRLRSRKEMCKYYQSLDFFLVTSSAEGTPNPALEAMSCGVPVITTKVGNMVEIVKEGKNGFFVSSVKSFQKAISKAKELSDENYSEMRNTTRRYIEPWDWSIKSKMWVEFFRSYQ